jgi:uncharacterized membrane protein YbaN (DUF454 family)
MSQRVIRGLWIAAGSFSLILGFIGIFLPLLPTIPFLLLAAACYLRGSDRMHKWIIGNKLFGAYIQNYREGKGIPLKATILSLLLLWITIGYSVVFVVHNSLVRLILILIALGVTAHLLSIKTPDQSSF